MNALPNFEQEGLLDGLSEPERAARLNLLRQLAEAGVPLEELRGAVAEGRLALLPIQHLLEERPAYTMREYVEQTGLGEVLITRNYLALGLPPPDPAERWFSEEQVAAGRVLKQVLDLGVSEEQIVGMARLLGRTSATTAEAVLELVAATAASRGESEHDLGLRWAELAQGLMPAIGPLLANVVGLHMRQLVRSEVLERTSLLPGVLPDTVETTVCFADLVGYTQLGETVSVEEVGRIANRFAALAADVALAPVRLIKLIGDAAMLVSHDTAALLQAATTLIAAVEREQDLPPVRAGVARGLALRHEGDWYGATVNLASRISSVAPAQAILATREVCDSAGERFRGEPWKQLKLKGIGEPVALYLITPAAT
jgi:adenylate cyclase